MRQHLKKVMICITLIITLLSFNNGRVKAEELTSGSEPNESVNQYANYSELDLYIGYAENILGGDTTVYKLDSINLLKGALKDAKDYKNLNPEPLAIKQDEIDNLSEQLYNSLYDLKVNDDMLNQIKSKIEEANVILNSGNEYDEDDFILLNNVTNEAVVFISDYENFGIAVFLPNNRNIGQVTNEVYGEVYRLSNKIANAIDRINLKPVSLPDLSEYNGSSISEGLYQVGEDGSYSGRDLLYAKAGFSDTYFGRAVQNVTMLSYFRGNGANTLDLELSMLAAENALNNGSEYDEKSLEEVSKALREADKFLEKYKKLGVKVLPTKQEKVEFLKNNLIAALKKLNLIKIDNTVENDIKSEISSTVQEINSYIPWNMEMVSELANGRDIYVFVEVIDYNDRISDEDKSLIDGSLESGEVIGTYLDINLYKRIGRSNIKISSTDGKIKISLTLPESLINNDLNKTRTYYVIRLHDGEVTRIPVTLENGMITFESDKFSVYAISYVDKLLDTTVQTNKVLNNPKTGDNALIYLSLLVISFMSLIVLRKVNN